MKKKSIAILLLVCNLFLIGCQNGNNDSPRMSLTPSTELPIRLEDSICMNDKNTIKRETSILLVVQEMEIAEKLAEDFMEKIDLLYHAEKLPFCEITSTQLIETEWFDNGEFQFQYWKLQVENEGVFYRLGGRLQRDQQKIEISYIVSDEKTFYRSTGFYGDYIKPENFREDSIALVVTALNVPIESAISFMEKIDVLLFAHCIDFSDFLSAKAIQADGNENFYDLLIFSEMSKNYSIRIELLETKIIIHEIANSSGEVMYSVS